MTPFNLALQAEAERTEKQADAAEATHEFDMQVLAEMVETWGIEDVACELKAICDRQSKGKAEFTYAVRNLEAFAFGYDDNSHIAGYDEF